VVVVAEQAIKAVVEIAQGRMARPAPDLTGKQAQVIQPTVVVVVVVVVDIMVALEAAVTGVHTVVGRVQATLVAKQEIREPAGVLLIQMDLRQMAEHQVGNRALRFRTMWDWVGRLDVLVAMDI